MFIHILFFIVSVYFVNSIPFRFDRFFSLLIILFNSLFLFLIIENITIPESFIKRCRSIILVLIPTAAIVSIIQYFYPLFFIYVDKYTGVDAELEGYARRILSIFTWGDLINSQYMSIGFIALYGIMLYEFKSMRNILIIIVLSAGIVVFLSQYRVAMLTYLITSVFLLFKKLSLKTVFSVAVIIVLFNFLLSYLHFNLNYFIEERLQSDSALTRIDAFSAFFHAFPESPFFGTGGLRTDALFEGLGRTGRLHNAYLATAYYYGAFALIAYGLTIIFLLRKTYLTGKRADYWPPFVGMLCFVVAIATMPSGSFFLPGIVFMLIFNKYYYDRYLISVSRNASKHKTIDNQ
ncbi:MAG: O-antigen ligase family protein [bacterium]